MPAVAIATLTIGVNLLIDNCGAAAVAAETAWMSRSGHD